MNISRPIRYGLALFIALPSVATFSGCVAVVAGAAAGAGTVAYVRGQLTSTLAKNYDAVERAANTALAQLQFVKTEEKKDALVAIINARTAEDRHVEIKISRQTETLTNVRIRVGLFGDEALSRIVLDKINANL